MLYHDKSLYLCHAKKKEKKKDVDLNRETRHRAKMVQYWIQKLELLIRVWVE